MGRNKRYKIICVVVMFLLSCGMSIVRYPARRGESFSQEDFLKYSETDSGGDITINTSRLITVSTMRRDANSWVSRDVGLNNIQYFKHRIKVNASLTDADCMGGIWGVSKASSAEPWDTESMWGRFDNAAASPRINFQHNGNSPEFDRWYNISLGTDYYIEIEHTSAAMTVRICDDADFSNDLTTMEGPPSVEKYQYYLPIWSRNSALAESVSYTLENYQIED